jgi:hypothetical protein
MYTVFNENWLAQNENRAYPLAFDAQAEDITGSFVLPTNLLLAMQLSVPALDNIDPARFFLSSIILTASGLTVRLSYDSGTSYTLVGSAVIPFDSHTSKDSYAISGANDFDDVTGKVVVGNITGLPAGQFDFSPEGGKLDPDVCRPFLRGLRGLIVQNSDDQEIELTGIVSLNSGTNIRFTVDGAETDTPTVRVDAIEGEGLNQGCECETQVGDPIRTINLVRPTTGGDISVIGDDAIDITVITNGIQIVNTKAKPCCGCAELEALTQRLEFFGGAKATLESFLNRLQGEVGNTLTNLLGSKLNDVPCYGVT